MLTEIIGAIHTEVHLYGELSDLKSLDHENHGSSPAPIVCSFDHTPLDHEMNHIAGDIGTHD